LNKKNYSIFNRITKPLRKKHDTNLESFRCPNCKHIVAVENKLTKKMFFHCPICGQKNIFKSQPKQLEKNYEKSHKNWLSGINFNAAMIGIILTLTSIVILVNKNPFTTKLSLTLLIIGTMFPLFMIEKKQNISTMITLGTIIYIIILFSITGTDLEIFLILIFLGVLVTKAVIDEYIPKPLKIRMNLFIILFFIIFMIIVTKRIINLVGI